MTPLPPPLGRGELVAWRLDQAQYRTSWDSGEGAYEAGGRWNSKGVRAVYCSLDPATAILEVAAHEGFKALDTVPHVLTAINLTDPSKVHVVDPAAVPNPNWLRPGSPGAGQQAFGDSLLALRLCLDRILGVRRGRPVELFGELALPPLANARDLAAAMSSVAAAATQGAITPDEAVALAQMVESFTRTLDAAHVERRRHWRGILWKNWGRKSQEEDGGAR